MLTSITLLPTAYCWNFSENCQPLPQFIFVFGAEWDISISNGEVTGRYFVNNIQVDHIGPMYRYKPIRQQALSEICQALGDLREVNASNHEIL